MAVIDTTTTTNQEIVLESNPELNLDSSQAVEFSPNIDVLSKVFMPAEENFMKTLLKSKAFGFIVAGAFIMFALKNKKGLL